MYGGSRLAGTWLSMLRSGRARKAAAQRHGPDRGDPDVGCRLYVQSRHPSTRGGSAAGRSSGTWARWPPVGAPWGRLGQQQPLRPGEKPVGVSDERPSVVLRRLVDGYQVTQAIHVAATLGI